MIEITSLLSAYGIGVHGTPSSLYTCSSAVKTVTRKNCCSFSLAKLMQSCSSELVGKHSNPKMSTAPMKKRESPPNISEELIASQTKSNIFEYTCAEGWRRSGGCEEEGGEGRRLGGLAWGRPRLRRSSRRVCARTAFESASFTDWA